MKKYILLPFLAVLVVVAIILVVSIMNYYDYPMLDTPEGFTELKFERNRHFEAVSGDDCKIVVERRDNTHEAPLEFVCDELEKQQTRIKNYVLVEKKDFETNTGEKGKYYVFETMVDGVLYTYINGIVCDEDVVNVISAAGEKDIFAKRMDAVVASFKTLH